MYRAGLTIDFSGMNQGEYNRLVAGLEGAGWEKVETSAFVWEGAELAGAWRGVVLAAKQTGSVGTLSALNFQIQRLDEQAGYKGTLDRTAACQTILAKPNPW